MGGGSVVCGEVCGTLMHVDELYFMLSTDGGALAAYGFGEEARPSLESRLGQRVAVRVVAEFAEPDPGPPASPRPTSWRDLPPMI
jgi:hypothetical protein